MNGSLRRRICLRRLLSAAALAVAILLVAVPAAGAADAKPWVPENTPYLNDIIPVNESPEWVTACIYPAGGYQGGKFVPEDVQGKARWLLTEKANDDAAGGDAPRGDSLREQYEEILNREDEPHGKQAAAEFLTNVIRARLDGLTPAQRSGVDALIDQRGASWVELAAPYQLSGCPPLSSTSFKLSIKDIFGDGILVFLVKVITAPLWVPQNLIYPFSTKVFVHYGLFTPHVERGETITTLLGCVNDTSPSCASIQERGFNDPVGGDASSRAAAENMKGAGWIRIMLSLRYLIASVFTLALLAACVLWMVRGGSERQNLHLLRLLPRLVLATLLLMMLPALIGAAITLSNQITQALFASETCGAAEVACSTRTGLTSALSQIQDAGGNGWSDVNADGAAKVLIGVLVGAASTLLMLLLLIVTVARQLTLALLIAVMPLAVGTLLFEKESTRALFEKWWKLVVAMLLIPPLMGIVLRVGMAMNPVISLTGEASQPGFGSWLVGAVIWLATLYGMWKTLPVLRKWATGSGQGMIGKGIQKGAPVAGAAAGGAVGNPALGARIGGAVGGMAGSAGSASLMPTRAEGQLAKGAASLGVGMTTGAARQAGVLGARGAAAAGSGKAENYLERSSAIQQASNKQVADDQLVEQMKQANARYAEQEKDVNARIYQISKSADGTQFGTLMPSRGKEAYSQNPALVQALAEYKVGSAVVRERGGGGEDELPDEMPAMPPPPPTPLPPEPSPPPQQETLFEADELDESRGRRRNRH